MPSLYLAESYNFITSLQEVKLIRHSGNFMPRLRRLNHGNTSRTAKFNPCQDYCFVDRSISCLIFDICFI